MTVDLHIKAGVKGSRTYLETGYCLPPFKIANITADKTEGPLELMLMSSSPGILDGDHYNLKIELAERACLHLQTQSYQRLFNMKTEATQCFEVRLADHSSFMYLPHPLVPHALSNFQAENKIYLGHKCTLIWSDVLTCGRKLNGEIFKFSRLHSLTEVYLNNRLVIKENLFAEPDKINLNALGQLEGYSHQASLIYVNEDAGIDALSKNIETVLSAEKDIAFGISEPSTNGLIIRLLGQKAEQLFDCLKTVASILTHHYHVEETGRMRRSHGNEPDREKW